MSDSDMVKAALRVHLQQLIERLTAAAELGKGKE